MAESRPAAEPQPRDVRQIEEEFRTPRVDIFETDESFVLIADMPGVSDKNVEVTLDQDTLSLIGRIDVPGWRATAFTRNTRHCRSAGCSRSPATFAATTSKAR